LIELRGLPLYGVLGTSSTLDSPKLDFRFTQYSQIR
jgi:hypothetical protein